MALTQDYLRECFTYDPHTGFLTWKHRPRHHFRTERGWKKAVSQSAGKRAGYLQGDRYRVGIDGKCYWVSRIIWQLVYGREPFNVIDHINGNPKDNRLRNLRIVTPRENNLNRKSNRHNHSIPMLRDECSWS